MDTRFLVRGISTDGLIFGFYIWKSDRACIYVPSLNREYPVDPSTVDRCIGYVSAEGSLIFERDFIRHHQTKEEFKVVVCFVEGDGVRYTYEEFDKEYGFDKCSIIA